MNETLRQTDECRAQCEVASQRLPGNRGEDGMDGVFEKAAGEKNIFVCLKMYIFKGFIYPD